MCSKIAKGTKGELLLLPRTFHALFPVSVKSSAAREKLSYTQACETFSKSFASRFRSR